MLGRGASTRGQAPWGVVFQSELSSRHFAITLQSNDGERGFQYWTFPTGLRYHGGAWGGLGAGREPLQERAAEHEGVGADVHECVAPAGGRRRECPAERVSGTELHVRLVATYVAVGFGFKSGKIEER